MKWVCDADGSNWRLEPSEQRNCYAPKFFAVCPRCGREGRKKDMITLLARQGSYDMPRTLCHMCQGCMTQLLDELEVSMPG